MNIFRKLIFGLALFLFIAVPSSGQNSYDEIRAQINAIKKDSKFLYADVTAATDQDAKDLAEDELYRNINEWAATQKELQGKANLVVNNRRELWTELKMPRGNMFRSFLYVKKKDIQGVDNAAVIDNPSRTDGSGLSSTVTPISVEGSAVADMRIPDAVAQLASIKSYSHFVTELQRMKVDGIVSFYGRYAELENPDIYYMAVYNRKGEMVALLTPTPERINVETRSTDSLGNYSGCGAIGFSLSEKEK